MRAENRSNLEQICVKLNLVLNEAHIYGECWYKIPPSSGESVIDGGGLLYAVTWQPFSTLKQVIYQYYSYVTSNYGISSTVVFDGYSDWQTLSVKDHEHNRRIMASGGYAHIQIEHHATVLLWDIAVCGANVIVVSNDTDVKIMLLYLYNSEMGDIIVKPFGSKKRRCPDIDIGKTSNSLNPHVLKYLLVIQAVSGCDATSARYSTKEKLL
ncbi:hypothetical protein GQR58_018410 [Nymphon striatum]|nr:hypothetical protein GQR58_018410 [Nymphon striatum]